MNLLNLLTLLRSINVPFSWKLNVKSPLRRWAKRARNHAGCLSVPPPFREGCEHRFGRSIGLDAHMCASLPLRDSTGLSPDFLALCSLPKELGRVSTQTVMYWLVKVSAEDMR